MKDDKSQLDHMDVKLWTLKVYNFNLTLAPLMYVYNTEPGVWTFVQMSVRWTLYTYNKWSPRCPFDAALQYTTLHLLGFC